MINEGRSFDTSTLFSGGAGMFIQYHDIIKPIYFYAIIKMILTKSYFGLPFDIIQNMTIFSLIEWYIKRRYKNPLQCIDYLKILDPDELDKVLEKVLESDDSISKLSPILNVGLMMNVYRNQYMSFPIYVYTEKEDAHIQKDCKNLFRGIQVKYLYGDLKEAIYKCDQNFTYILSDIELIKEASRILSGTCSHILLAREYRYNYTDNCKTLKYDIVNLAQMNPYIRIGTFMASDMNRLALSFKNIISREGNENATT